MLWEKDGRGGEDDIKNSMSALLHWWNTGNNYRKCWDKNNRGKEKMKYRELIAIGINNISRCTRNAHSVTSKIQGMELLWQKANDWAGATGKGIKQSQGQLSLEAVVNFIIAITSSYTMVCYIDVHQDC